MNGSDLSQKMLSAKFVNGGCFIGRVGHVKQYIVEGLSFMRAVGDDQVAATMFHLSKPHILSLDIDNEYFQCVYKEDIFSFKIDYSNCGLIQNGKSTNVGLLHFNGGMYTALFERYSKVVLISECLTFLLTVYIIIRYPVPRRKV